MRVQLEPEAEALNEAAHYCLDPADPKHGDQLDELERLVREGKLTARRTFSRDGKPAPYAVAPRA